MKEEKINQARSLVEDLEFNFDNLAPSHVKIKLKELFKLLGCQ